MLDRRPLFVVNPVAGGGRARAAVPRIRTIAGQVGARPEIVFSDAPGHVEELARKGAEDGFAPIVGVGGDGTLHELVNGLMRAPDPPPLGVVPAGKGNDFARSLALPLPVDEAVRGALTGSETAIDVGTCGSRFFLNVGGVGFDAAVAAAANRGVFRLKHGTAAYVVAVLGEIWRYQPSDVRMLLDGEVVSRSVLLVAVAVGPYYGGGMRICPDADRRDGLLDVCIVEGLPRLEVVRVLPSVFTGGHAKNRHVSFHRARTIRIEGPPSVSAHLDGETIGGLPLDFGVRPGALRVVAPSPSK